MDNEHTIFIFMTLWILLGIVSSINLLVICLDNSLNYFKLTIWLMWMFVSIIMIEELSK